MQLEQKIKNIIKYFRNNNKILLILFAFVYFILRIPFLGANELNPDGINWHKRSEQFVVAFKTGELSKTYQHYHPGVTLMWIVGPSVELAKQLTDLGNVYNSENFLAFNFVSKLALLFANLGLTIFLLYFLQKLIGNLKAVAIVFLFNMEPFVLGNSRILHMDILFANLTALSLVTAFYAYKTKKLINFAIAGFFTSLAILTRSLGIGLFLYNLAFFGYIAFLIKNKVYAKGALIFVFSFTLFCFGLFPALWVSPVKTIDDIFSRSFQIGVEDGHNQVFFGNFTTDPGVLFYILVLLIKTTPFTILGVIFFKYFVGKNLIKPKQLKTKLLNLAKFKTNSSFFAFLFVFYVGYFLVLNVSSKKIDRYLIPLYFLASFASVYGYYYFYKVNNKKFLNYLLGGFFVICLTMPIVRFSPFEFLYYSPFFVNSKTANSVVLQKNFGMGLFGVRDFLLSRYSCHSQPQYPTNFKPVIYSNLSFCNQKPQKVTIGLSDPKAIKEIYGNTYTRDSRTNSGKKYDVLVLAINEEMPKSIQENKLNFVHDASIFVHNVELWRFYVKQP